MSSNKPGISVSRTSTPKSSHNKIILHQGIPRGLLLSNQSDIQIDAINVNSSCSCRVVFCQAYYYINELTQESSWDSPRSAPEKALAEVTLGGDIGILTPSAESTGVVDKSETTPGAAGSFAGQQPSIVVPDDTGTAAAAHVDRGFPFYVNERGNRVFCVPPKASS